MAVALADDSRTAVSPCCQGCRPCDVHQPRVPVAAFGLALRPPMRPDPELRVAEPVGHAIMARERFPCWARSVDRPVPAPTPRRPLPRSTPGIDDDRCAWVRRSPGSAFANGWSAKHEQSNLEFNPDRRVIAGLLPASRRAVDPGGFKSLRQARTKQRMVDADSGAALNEFLQSCQKV